MKNVLVVEIKEEQQDVLHAIVAISYDIGNSTDSITSSNRRIVSNELERRVRKL
jgi:hypothetical protein